MATLSNTNQVDGISDWECPLCGKSGDVRGLSSPLWELSNDKPVRFFDRICKKCSYFFNANTKSGRTF